MENDTLEAMVEVDKFDQLREEKAALMGDMEIVARGWLKALNNESRELEANLEHLTKELIAFAKKHRVILE